MFNLINNARDAVADVSEPKICITLRPHHADAMFRNLHKEVEAEQYVCLTISDNGSGISKSEMKHVFEPFYTTKEINKGTGLGLSMTLGTIQSHHGYIDIDSKVGKGTSFHVYLPLLEKEDHTFVQQDTPESSEHANAHILIADDESYILESITEVLKDNGYIVYSAADGKEALEIFHEHQDHIQLAILDMSMPGLTGIQVAKEIRKLTPNFPIIFNSGYDKNEMPDEMIDCKCCLKLQKPVEMGLLIQSVCELLDVSLSHA